jgi:hypothetical protein
MHRAVAEWNRALQKATGNAINVKELLPLALGMGFCS